MVLLDEVDSFAFFLKRFFDVFLVCKLVGDGVGARAFSRMFSMTRVCPQPRMRWSFLNLSWTWLYLEGWTVMMEWGHNILIWAISIRRAPVKMNPYL